MITQFKTLDDIAELIKEYETILMRPTLKLSHPTYTGNVMRVRKSKSLKAFELNIGFYPKTKNG